MPVVPDLLSNNERFAADFDKGDLPMPPAKHVAILAFADLDNSVREDLERIRSHPLIPDDIPVSGYVNDVTTGRLREVVDTAG
jgi:carbonic anhydrase